MKNEDTGACWFIYEPQSVNIPHDLLSSKKWWVVSLISHDIYGREFTYTTLQPHSKKVNTKESWWNTQSNTQPPLTDMFFFNLKTIYGTYCPSLNMMSMRSLSRIMIRNMAILKKNIGYILARWHFYTCSAISNTAFQIYLVFSVV